jgi:hypothetical protein
VNPPSWRCLFLSSLAHLVYVKANMHLLPNGIEKQEAHDNSSYTSIMELVDMPKGEEEVAAVLREGYMCSGGGSSLVVGMCIPMQSGG